MLDALRERLALQGVRRAAARRGGRPWPDRLRERRVLVVLPGEEAALLAAWRFVQGLAVPPSNVTPVTLAGHAAYVPDAFAGSVVILGPSHRDWRGLPARSEAEGMWSRQPDLALDLIQPFDAGAAYLVAGAPASFRAGLYDPRAEPFYDLLVAPAQDPDATLGALGRGLEAVAPPVVLFR